MAEHPWTRFCDLAECSPDFDVVKGMGPEEAIDWLWERLLNVQDDPPIPWRDVEAAYWSWPPE